MTPAFITLTGANRSDLIPAMQGLSAKYPNFIEWGILIGLSPEPRFADQATMEVLRCSGLRLSAHLCGPLAEAIFAGQILEVDLAGFSRVQVNKPEGHASASEREAAMRFGRKIGLRTILQCAGPFPNDPRCDWLLDSSHGRGVPLPKVPSFDLSSAFCGLSGGISSRTVHNVLAQIKTSAPPFWLDAESALQDASGFSIEACDELVRSVVSI
jgi:hypothetical protein